MVSDLPRTVKATIIAGLDYRPTVQRINRLEPVMETLTDDELRAKTEELKARLKKAEKAKWLGN